MIVYEILNFNRELLHKISTSGIRLEDYKYVALYSDYIYMRNDGQKVTYIIAFLANKYHFSERKVYSIISHLSKELNCKKHAVG